MKLTKDDICPICKKQQTQDHILFYCNKFKSQRKQLYQNLQIDNPAKPYEIFNNHKNIRILQSFLAKTIGNSNDNL